LTQTIHKEYNINKLYRNTQQAEEKANSVLYYQQEALLAVLAQGLLAFYDEINYREVSSSDVEWQNKRKLLLSAI